MDIPERDMGLPAVSRDPWLNPHLGPHTKRAHEVVGAVVKAVEKHGRKRALRSKDKLTFFKVIIPLVANLIHHYLSRSPGQGIPVPKAKNELGKPGDRYQPFLFPRSFPKLLKALTDLGFSKETIGKFSGLPRQSKRTTVSAGPKLIELIERHKVTLDDLDGSGDEEVIILQRPKYGHWDEGARVDYKDTAATHRFRAEVRALNVWWSEADIRFEAPAGDTTVNAQNRKVYRRFTLGRFDRGGRLFGGFWQPLPKPARLDGIRIESETVVGLDYSQTNPVLAYCIAKATPPAGDAYMLTGLEQCREGVKKVFNAMLFKHPVEHFPKGSRKLFPRRVRCEDVVAAILDRHPKLKGVLSSPETGHQLQFLESEIMMGVLRQCRKRNIVALPVFDCVVVKASEEHTVRRFMRREFKAVTGLNVTVKRELSDQGNP